MNQQNHIPPVHYAHRDAQIIAEVLVSQTYPLPEHPLSIGLAPLDHRLRTAQANGEDLVTEFLAFCTEFEIPELHQAVRAVRPDRQAIPHVLADVYGWRGFSLAAAYATRPPTAYVIAGMFSLPSLNIVYGAPGCLKSMLLADAAVCVASGESWLPALPQDNLPALPVKQCPVLWIDYDNGTRRTLDRLGALARARQLPVTTPLTCFSMASPWLDANSAAEMANLHWRIMQLEAKFIVIDNLGTVSGDADENSAAMIKVLGHFRQLAEETGAAVVLIHHQRKGHHNGGRAGDALRGHSSIEAALDLALLVTREDETTPYIDIKSTKTRDIPVMPRGARFTYEYKPNSQDLDTARFFGTSTELDDNSEFAIDAEILDTLRHSNNLSQSEIIEIVKSELPDASKKKIRQRILFHEGRGTIENSGRGINNAKQYCLKV